MAAGSGFQEVVPYAVNFTLTVGLLGFFLRQPVRRFVYQRHERMKDAVEAAAIAHQKAQARSETARKMAAGLASEEQGLLSRERAEAERERAEVLQKAKAEAERLKQEAERLAAVEREEALDKVKEEFLRQVVETAERNLQQGLKKDDHLAILKRAQNSIEVGV